MDDLAREEMINFGAPREITMLYLAQEAPKLRCTRTNRASALPGWKPRISLAQGRGSTVAYFLALRNPVA